MNKAATQHFRDQFRAARENTQQDAEAFEVIIHVVERLGYFLTGTQRDLGRYATDVCDQAKLSPLAEDIPNDWQHFHIPFPKLYEIVREGRNDAMHQGAVARHLTNHAIELAIVLEHSLMPKQDRVTDYMVRNVDCAALWQPLSFIRQAMLKSSFSYLPFEADGKWRLVSDCGLATYLRKATTNTERGKLLGQTLEKALEDGLKTEEPYICAKEDSCTQALEECNGFPCLVIVDSHLLGILTPFDLL